MIHTPLSKSHHPATFRGERFLGPGRADWQHPATAESSILIHKTHRPVNPQNADFPPPYIVGVNTFRI